MHCRVQFVFSKGQTDQMTQNVSNSVVSVEIKLNVKMSSRFELDMVWPWPKLTPRPHTDAAYLCCRNAGANVLLQENLNASLTFVSDSSRYCLTNSWIPFFQVRSTPPWLWLLRDTFRFVTPTSLPLTALETSQLQHYSFSHSFSTA